MLFLFDLNINNMQVYRFFAKIQNERKKSLECLECLKCLKLKFKFDHFQTSGTIKTASSL